LKSAGKFIDDGPKMFDKGFQGVAT
jgi:hypothetical protein